ncbi:alternative ribosome rescue aminoacyl-tRNA hydrolase ArfB [Cyclobacterium jeungdonense]|uniref:Alternative ribosome rescue aminoacyl-tRNA hydrolase ArfB n=1 Tax=Cyclobacterium jeungdonense TaxID=708087 RepID=A0ABT8CB63_9BACT|nr:alternative ribosome rescue aminoacyl-tRNA hydrolase ArfB [Cyclobacterium jeungdonense]MDN3690053.1 alternative ribosome rescue aminoacyl-tRNA hydrolase ArfB [Cyclobacterium jeungdonense]
MSITQKIKEEFFNPEISFQASKSSGPGGQHVNKVNTKIILLFNIPQSNLLLDHEKAILLRKLTKKLDKEGNLVITSQDSRSQIQNKKKAIKKFYGLLKKAFHKKKPRIATKPGRAAKEKRLKAKKIQSEKKQLRGKDW